MLDACSRELSDRARYVVDYGVHHLARLKREASLSCVVDLLRANDFDLGAVELLGEFRTRETQNFIQGEID